MSSTSFQSKKNGLHIQKYVLLIERSFSRILGFLRNMLKLDLQY